MPGIDSQHFILRPAFCNSAISQKVNFSGIWQVDSLNSNVGHFVVAATLKIVQTTDTISIGKTYLDAVARQQDANC